MTELEQYMNTTAVLIKQVEKAKETEKLLTKAITLLRDEYGTSDLAEKLGTNKETIQQYDKKKRILDTINYSDIKYNYFNDWLTEALDYECNIVFDKDDIDEDEDDYKELYDIRDIDIQFREEYAGEDDCDIAVYCKPKNEKKWWYVDNITRKLYERRFE